jgi:hypothetical protein
MLDGQCGKMSIGDDVPLCARHCKQVTKNISVALSRLRRPSNLTRQPVTDLAPRLANRFRVREYTRIGHHSQKGEQTRPRQSNWTIPAEPFVKPSSCDFVLSKRPHIRVDENVRIYQDHLNVSPSLIESTSAMLSRLPTFTRPKSTERVRNSRRFFGGRFISCRPRRKA